jgi:hypothetical protein
MSMDNVYVDIIFTGFAVLLESYFLQILMQIFLCILRWYMLAFAEGILPTVPWNDTDMIFASRKYMLLNMRNIW